MLDAAEYLLSEQGVDLLTLREVAKIAGVSHAAPYHHFKNREALLAGVAARGFDALANAMRSEGAHAPAERLAQTCEAYIAFARQYPARFRLMFGPLLARKREFPELKDAAERSFYLLLNQSEAADAANGLDLALAGWAMAHGLAHLSIDGCLDSLPVPVDKSPELERRLGTWLLRGDVKK